MSIPQPMDIQWFLEICKTQNFTRASERLGVSQPALSQAIRRLETLLKVDLFKRERTGVSLTRPGELLREKSSMLLDQWVDLTQTLTRNSEHVWGVYTIGLHSSIVMHTADTILLHLMNEFDQLSLRLVHDISRRITEDVISQKIDFGIVVNPIEQEDLVIKRLAQDNFSFWSIDRADAVFDYEDMPCIYHPELKQTHALLKELPFKPKRFIESTSLEVIAHLVGRGAGLGILPERLMSRLAPSSAVVKRHEHLGVVADDICLIYRADRHTSEASKRILQALRTSQL